MVSLGCSGEEPEEQVQAALSGPGLGRISRKTASCRFTCKEMGAEDVAASASAHKQPPDRLLDCRGSCKKKKLLHKHAGASWACYRAVSVCTEHARKQTEMNKTTNRATATRD